MNTEFLHLFFIAGLLLVMVVMSIFIICFVIKFYRDGKPKKILNTNKDYVAFVGKNIDMTLVSFTSGSKFELTNAVYWAGKNGLNLSRVLYLDLDTKFIYRPNFGHFDMSTDYDVDIERDKKDDSITNIRIKNTKNDITMNFNYVKKF